MSRTITIPEDLYAHLESLARPFIDKEPADVIAWLVDKEAGSGGNQSVVSPSPSTYMNPVAINGRSPRERGATVALDGTVITADSVPDLYSQVMEYLFSNGHWDRVVELAPYKTSSKRYLISKTPLHPNGKDFFVPVKYQDMYMEAHKNYKTAIEQLARFVLKCGVNLAYRGT